MNIKIKTIAFLLTSLFCIQLLACTQESETQAIKNQNETENIDTMKLKITIELHLFRLRYKTMRLQMHLKNACL